MLINQMCNTSRHAQCSLTQIFLKKMSLILCALMLMNRPVFALAVNVTESVYERIQLEHILIDEIQQSKNRRALWLTLITLPEADLKRLKVDKDKETELHAWLQLVAISKKTYANTQDMLADIEQWKSRFPDHPGQYILSTGLSEANHDAFSNPKHIALLLPLTGPLAGPGAAIKDGFMAGVAPDVNVRLYDTEGVQINALYQQVIADGADYVVGPLSKAQVARVAVMEHPVPTLLLNDAEGLATEHAYPFGLSPIHEAKQVAIKAIQDGRSRALVIAPAGAWGDEIATAFASQWRRHGGAVVGALSYEEKDDMNAIMRDFLGISACERRGKELKQWLGQHIELPLVRRQDFDMIFLLAYPSKARQIMPLLNYYYAGDVPVYATSSVYTGSVDAKKDKDLNGIIFCDMPWVFEHQMGHKNWPEQLNSYNRLYALGKESYALSTRLDQLLMFNALGVGEDEGVLYLSPSRQVKRVLSWGQFKEGLACKERPHV